MPDDTHMGLRQRVEELERILGERTAERDEALAREAAMAEVVKVINSSPGDLEPVFQAIVEKAHTLCGAVCGSLQLWDGEKFRGIAMRGFPGPMVEALRQGYVPGPNHPCRELIDGARIAHCADMAAVDDRVTRLGAKLSGVRTVVYVALRATARCAAAVLTRPARGALGPQMAGTVCRPVCPSVQLLPSRSIALRVVSILRITATIATFGFLPAATRRWWKVRSAGLNRNAARAGI